MLTVLGALGLENDSSVNQCEQGVILAASYVGSGVELGATLANQYIASCNFLPAETLNAKALGNRIATVAGTTACFLMCHLPVTSLLSR
jgi:hypothetical protein